MVSRSLYDAEYEQRHQDALPAVPKTGPLGAYLQWATRTTDANLFYHVACALVVWGHHMNVHQLLPPNDNAFRETFWLIGQPAASKSTAIKRIRTFYEKVIEPKASQGGVDFSAQSNPFVQAAGTPAGLYETIAAHADPETGWHLGVFFHEEISSQFRMFGKHTAASYIEFLCQQLEGTRMDRNLVKVHAANKQKAGSETSRLDNYAFPGIFATTFGGLDLFFDRNLITGGLFSRILFVIGTRGRLTHALRVQPRRREQDYALDVWKDWNDWARGMRLTEGVQGPAKVRLDPGLEDDVLGPTLFRDLQESYGDMASSLKRGLERAKTLAALLALNDQKLAIEQEHLEAAVKLVYMSVQGLETLAANVRTQDNPHAPELARAFRIIRSAGPNGIPRSMLLKQMRVSVKIFNAVIEQLQHMEVIDYYTKTGGRGRPPSYYVALYDTLEPDAKQIDENVEAMGRRTG